MHRVRAFKTKHTYKLYVKLTHLTYMFFFSFYYFRFFNGGPFLEKTAALQVHMRAYS